jgi:hypothetical protein
MGYISIMPTNEKPEKVQKETMGNCYKCKEFKMLDPHHRVKRRNDKEDKYVVYLCRACHNWVEGHPSESKELGLHIPYYNTEEYKNKYGKL